MRPIEFRAWDLITKQMIYLNDALCSVPYYEIFCHTPDDRPWELMQFTGLLDKNGKKIFEGDLLREYHYPDVRRCIWFDEGAGFVFQAVKNKDWIWCPNEYSTANEWEVIGNIYENPELLKEGKP
jgi:uncharacterized phage protein (TIGR01671 family)